MMLGGQVLLALVAFILDQCLIERFFLYGGTRRWQRCLTLQKSSCACGIYWPNS